MKKLFLRLALAHYRYSSDLLIHEKHVSSGKRELFEKTYQQ